MALFNSLVEDFEDHIGRFVTEINSSQLPLTGKTHYDLRSFHSTDLTAPRTMPDFKYWNAAHFDGIQVSVLTAPRSLIGRSVTARIMNELDLLTQGNLDPKTIQDIELNTVVSGNEGWPIGDSDVTVGKDSALRYANSIRVNLTDGVTKTVTSSFFDNILTDFPSDGSTYYVELALPGFQSQEIAGTALTVSGNEITDATRTTNTQGDGRPSPDSSFGIWEGSTNLVLNGGAETNTTGWNSFVGTTQSRDTTLGKFGTSSMKAVTTADTNTGLVYGSAANDIPVTVGTTYSYSVWILFPLGQSGNIRIDWRTAGSAGISQTSQSFTGTGAWQRVTVVGTAPATAAFAYLDVIQTSAVAQTFWVDGMQFEAKPIPTPYIHTNGGTAARAAARTQVAIGSMDETQSWVAIRLRMGFSATANLSGTPVGIFNWIDNASEGIVIQYSDTDDKFHFFREHLNVGTQLLSAAQTFNTNDSCTIIAAWTATGLKLSINGVAFVTNADVNIPTLAATLADIGSLAATNQANSNISWYAYGTGTLTDADAATIHGFGDNDPSLNQFSVAATAKLIAPMNTTVTSIANTVRLDLTNSFIDFTSDVGYAAGQTDSIPFSASLNNIGAGGNTFFRISRNSLVNTNLSNLSGLRFRLKSIGNLTFVAQALRVYKNGDFTYPSVSIDTKRDTLAMEVPQTGTQIGDPTGDSGIIYFNGVRPKNITETIRFNSGHLHATNSNILHMYLRRDFNTNNEIRVILSSTTGGSGTVLSIDEKTNGVSFSTVYTTNVSALVAETDYYLVVELQDTQLRATIYKANGSFFGTQLMTSGWRTVAGVRRGYVGYRVLPYYYDFSIDWIRNSHAEFAKYEEVSGLSIRPLIGATLYPQTSPAIDLTNQDFISSGDATYTTDPNFGDPAPSQKFVRTGVSFFGGIQTEDFILVGDLKHAYVTGKLYPQTASIFRIVLVDKNDTIAFIEYINDLKSGQWNEFLLPINANIAPMAYRVVIQQLGFTAGSFWLQDLKLLHDAFEWSASPNGGTNWYKFFNATNAEFKGVNFKSTPGNLLKVRAVALTDNGRISGYTIVPHYGYTGRK